MSADAERIGNQRELLIQHFQFISFRMDLFVCDPLLLPDHVTVPGKCIERTELRCTVIERHVRADRRLPVRMINDIRIDVAAVSFAVFQTFAHG